MKTKPLDRIGVSDIDPHDPYALMERISYLVRHEHDFARPEYLLERLLNENSGKTGAPWDTAREFLGALGLFHDALDRAEPDTESYREKVATFPIRKPTKFAWLPWIRPGQQ